MNIIGNIWDRISLLGTHYDLPEHLNRKIILGNRISALAGSIVFLLSFFYLDFLPQFLSYLVGALLCFALIFFNYLGKHKFSRIFFMLSIPVLLSLSGVFLPEPVRMIQKISILTSITIPLVLFGITEKKWMTMGIIWTIAFFAFFDYIHLFIPVEQVQHYAMYDPTVVQLFGALVSFSIFIATYIYLQKLNLEAEDKLKQLLQQSIRQRQEIENQKRQLEIHNRELNIRALSAQMNPHFLYNSLNSIQHFLTINDKVSSLTYLSKFGKLIRQFIDYSDKGMIPLADELKLLKYYLELESMRFDSMFQYNFNVDDELLLHNIQVPLLLIQTHVENAILHGLIGKEGDRQLNITFAREDDMMLCVIEDNGIGREASAQFNKKKSSYHKSRGIDISSQRMQLMYEDHLQDTLINIIDLYHDNQCPAGTRVELRIPFESI